MRKIPTLFQRNPDDMRRLLPEVHPDCHWVLAGEGTATAKLDGVCTMLDEHGDWWARREVKRGKTEPDNFVQVQHDPGTGKRVGWEPMRQSGFAKIHAAALDRHEILGPGTYELCGPKINGNPHKFYGHGLHRHGAIILPDIPTGFESLRDLMAEWDASPLYEGIVWHHPDGRRAKIKVRDFSDMAKLDAWAEDIHRVIGGA
jgi:hypothetical protein